MCIISPYTAHPLPPLVLSCRLFYSLSTVPFVGDQQHIILTTAEWYVIIIQVNACSNLEKKENGAGRYGAGSGAR